MEKLQNQADSLNFVLSAGAKPPIKATLGAAGFDLFALKREFFTQKDGQLTVVEPKNIKQFDLVRYNTGVFCEIPKGYVGLAFARSSIVNMPLIMANTTGVIDSDYRGEIMYVFRILNPENIEETSYQSNDRIGQLVIVKSPDLRLTEVNTLSDSERGRGGYGSTGR